jgi:hypothetical protein
MLLIVVVLLIGILLSLRTYYEIKTPLESAQQTLTTLAHSPDTLNSAMGRSLTEDRLATASNDIAAAQRSISSSWGLRILGVVPGLHTQRAGLQQLTQDLQTTTKGAIALLRSVNALAAASHGTNISLPKLKALGTLLETEHSRLASTDRPTRGLWGPLGSYRQKFDREDARAIRLLRQGVDLTKYAQVFLGSDGPRTYLVLGENNAEMRDQGATLSYSILHTSDGTISESTGGSVNDIELNAPAPGVTIPTGTQAAFGELYPTQTWQSTNATANFSFSGRDMQAMFLKAKGIQVDGVIGLDVVALQGLLALTGPVTVPNIAEPVSSSNAADILLNQLYEGLLPNSPQGPRREALSAVTSAEFHQLQTGNVDVVALARTLATEVSERHLQVWDQNPGYEQTLNAVGAAGNVDSDDPSRSFHVAVENATATKLDYFVHVAISATVNVNSDGSAVVDTRVTLKNDAPSGQAPSYQLGPDGINSHVVGQYVGRVLLWSPLGSIVGGGIDESGLVVFEEDRSVLPGNATLAQFSTTIPHAIRHGVLKLIFVPQPRLDPESLTVHIVPVGKVLLTKSRFRVDLVRTTTMTWHFS